MCIPARVYPLEWVCLGSKGKTLYLYTFAVSNRDDDAKIPHWNVHKLQRTNREAREDIQSCVAVCRDVVWFDYPRITRNWSVWLRNSSSEGKLFFFSFLYFCKCFASESGKIVLVLHVFTYIYATQPFY